MSAELLDVARRYADAQLSADGVAQTPIPGLMILRETTPTPLQHAITRPLVAAVLQGSKRVMMGSQTFDFGACESLLITSEVPTVSQITRASLKVPYYSLVVELDPAVIQTLVVEMGAAPFAAGSPVRVDPTEAEVSDAALRLLRLLERPAALPILRAPLLRELHFWLLSGRHGGAIRALGITDSHAQRIGRAVSRLRTEYASPLHLERLAEAAGMSLSTFHAHFRSITAFTPLQYQKQLRLIEARRSMLADGTPIATAAYAVGYESVPQFTREYRRMFGLPPARDVRHAREHLRRVA
jgi:AraC-like DNA-binding protein